ncbi:MAG: T9SS type A sorting domain-containing protein [Bacteroidia bacterium]
MKKYITFLIFAFVISAHSFAGCGGPYGGFNCPALGVDMSTGYSYIGQPSGHFIDTVYSPYSSTDTVFFAIHLHAMCAPGFTNIKLYKNGVLDSGLIIHSITGGYDYTFSSVGTATYTWTFMYAGFYTYTHTAVFLTATSLSEPNLSAINIYPNPSTTGLYSVDFKSTSVYTLKIMNSAGQLIKIIKKEDELLSVDLSMYPRGLYFFLLSGSDWSRSTKIVYD